MMSPLGPFEPEKALCVMSAARVIVTVVMLCVLIAHTGGST